MTVIQILEKQESALRNHREFHGLWCPTLNEGKIDSLIEQYLLINDWNATYIDPDIQNFLILSLSANVLSMIIVRKKLAWYFATFVDSTVEISSID